MKRYLVLSDMDDTLLSHDKKILPKTKEFLLEFTSRGNIFAICTGRPYSGVIYYYDELGLPMPLVTDNGCAIYNLDGKTKFFEIPLVTFRNFLKEVQGMDACMYTTTGYDISYIHNRSLVPSWIIHDETPGLQIIDGEPVETVAHAPLICNFWLKEEFYESFMEIIKKYENEIFYRNWGLYDGVYSIEIHSACASKGLALRYLKEYYHIDEDKTMAFGDQLNDLSMIEEAHYGVAMVNAVEELKEKTKYVTKLDFDHDGVIDFIKTHQLY